MCLLAVEIFEYLFKKKNYSEISEDLKTMMVMVGYVSLYVTSYTVYTAALLNS